jgi:Amidohydrolase
MSVSAPNPQKIKDRLGHPVIDFDGHLHEFLPAFYEVLAGIAGPAAVDQLRSGKGSRGVPGQRGAEGWYALTAAERRERGIERPSFWNFPTSSALDRATAAMPGLLYERQGELGFDFSLLYPSVGLHFPHLEDADLRIAACRALNELHAEVFAPYRDRLEPVAVIPMHTPAEGVSELNHAVEQLGLKAALIPSYVRRPLAKDVGLDPAAARYAFRFDTYGIDSDHDYDPVWETSVRLGIGLSTHSPGRGFGTRCSPSNYCYNHVGHFAASAEAVCKSLIFGGVPVRHPSLRFAFLEGGPAWALSLCRAIQRHLGKRKLASLKAHLDPDLLDADAYGRLLGKWSSGRYRRLVESGDLGLDLFMEREPGDCIDDWELSGIRRADDIDELFDRNFWIGCESDDALISLAFGAVGGMKLNAVLGSDIGHWDVPDFSEVLGEVVEAAENGAMTADQLADFTYRNAVRYLAGGNPSFFDGTPLQEEARRVV